MALQKRPPVITIMGHVDHGKTSLLDFIRQSKLTAKEAGGITQHIGAYSVEHQGQPLTFIDTPGHAAFNKMRERGSKITDIVVLVVAANDGVKPQTIESIRHIKTAAVPVVVAINKIDLPDVNLDVPKSQLAEQGLLVNEYGGDVEAVPLSALTGQGVDKLLETLAVMADLLELQADPAAPLKAAVIESSMDRQRGAVATVIVQDGTLSVRQDITTGEAEGRVKMLTNEEGQSLNNVLPGFPAEIIGFKDVPAVGAIVKDAARDYPVVEVAEEPAATAFQAAPADFDFNQLLQGDKPKIKLIVKADVQGTLEAILANLDEDSTELLSSGVGQVSEGDVEMAEATGAGIIAFRINIPGKIKKMAKEAGIKIKQYEVIYELIEDLQKQMLKMLEPGIDEVETGTAEILQIFEMRGERIAGVRVKTGEINKSDLLHLKRGDLVVANPVIKSMMHGKEEIAGLKTKNEGGLTFKNKKLDFQVGDLIQAYTVADE